MATYYSIEDLKRPNKLTYPKQKPKPWAKGNGKPTSVPKTPLNASVSKAKSKPRVKSIKSLKRRLDEIYSQYTRRKGSDEQGYVTCYCGVRIPWQESDNSHYIPRGVLSLRYEPKNTHPSCRRCNRFMGGNLQAYALYLRRLYGEEILEWLDKEKRKIVKNFPYQEKISSYSTLLAELQK